MTDPITDTAPARPDGRRGATGAELHVSDVDASIRFYEALGFRVARRWGDWVRLDRDGAEIVLQGDGYVRSHPHYFSALIDRSPRGTGVEITVQVEDVEAVHAGHFHIADDEVENFRLDRLQGVAAVLGRNDIMAFFFKHKGKKIPHALFIVNNQDFAHLAPPP